MAIRVVAALICDAGRILACQRKKGGAFPLKWEFPGGKVEEGEKDFAALRRELREELGIEVESAEEVFRNGHRYSDGTQVELKFFRVESYRGEISNRAFQRLLWVKLPELEKMDFLEGDRPLIEKLLRKEIF